MAVSNLERYHDIYARMPACQIPDTIRDLYKERFGALEPEPRNGELFIDSDADHVMAAFDRVYPEGTKLSGGFYYIFAHCGDRVDYQDLIDNWFPFHLFNMMNPGSIKILATEKDYSLIEANDERIGGKLYIILYKNYGVLAGGERSLAELFVLADGFQRTRKKSMTD